MIIRQEKSTDFAQVDQINQLAFDGEAEMRLVQDLRTNGDMIFSVVAEDDGKIVGHIAYSRGMIQMGEDTIPSVALGPMAVHPAFQGRSIGSKLIGESLQALTAMGESHCFVLGHTWFYPKFGFVLAANFDIGSAYQAGEHFMALELVPDSLKSIHGRFVYPSAFDGV